jgi:hypothetical protein
MQVEDFVLVIGYRGGLGGHYIEWIKNIKVRLLHNIDFDGTFMMGMEKCVTLTGV